jgi:hypothetical protein
MKKKTNKKILTYFLDSKLWKHYEKDRLTNLNFWKNEDPFIYYNMLKEYPKDKLGLYIEDYIYALLDCSHASTLKPKTKKRLYDEIAEIELYHINKGSIKDEL